MPKSTLCASFSTTLSTKRTFKPGSWKKTPWTENLLSLEAFVSKPRPRAQRCSSLALPWLLYSTFLSEAIVDFVMGKVSSLGLQKQFIYDLFLQGACWARDLAMVKSLQSRMKADLLKENLFVTLLEPHALSCGSLAIVSLLPEIKTTVPSSLLLI